MADDTEAIAATLGLKRYALVGHSMGAGHALQLAEEHPNRYAAVAALGGGRVNKVESL